jgi:SAM-dependent methyltransferase
MNCKGSVFGSAYAALYDYFYQEKNYKLECDAIESAALRYGPNPCRRVLDLGCGTGGHAFELAARGFVVDGVDLSAAMLDVAQRKLRALEHGASRQPVTFRRGDLRTVDLRSQYDLATMMFAVLGYQTTNQDVLAALHNVRKHLAVGGLLVFDVWYGPAVLCVRPERRTRQFNVAGARLSRTAATELDTYSHTAKVSFHVDAADPQADSPAFSEAHVMRYFFPQELCLFLDCAGFSLRSISAFPSLDAPVGEATWNALVVAQAS